jgi:Co/Zn/Cd efflux system component
MLLVLSSVESIIEAALTQWWGMTIKDSIVDVAVVVVVVVVVVKVAGQVKGVM